jgi:His-Xaa-Ser system protein HxsD
MDPVELTIDSALFSVEVLTRTAHRYTADFYVDIRTDAGTRVYLTAKRPEVDTANLAQRFRNDLLDDRLRAVIAGETADLHAVLVRAALTEACGGA